MHHQILDLSSISEYDYARIKASWVNLTDDNFQCARAEEEYSNRRNAEVDISYRRIEKGCGKMFENPRVIIDSIGFHSCLCHPSFQYENMGGIISIYEDYKNGMLPDKGGSLDQTSYNMDLIGLVGQLHDEREIAMNKKQQQDLNKKK